MSGEARLVIGKREAAALDSQCLAAQLRQLIGADGSGARRSQRPLAPIVHEVR
jgi:hypothetical protein